MSTTYHPYEELSCSLIETSVTLSTPWTDIEAEIPEEARADVDAICTWINRAKPAAATPGDVAAEASALKVSGFLENFKDHYVAYSAPRALRLNPAHCSHTVNRLAIDASPAEWIAAYVPAAAARVDFTGKRWALDASDVLRASRVPGEDDIHDPVSAFRYLLRWALKTVHERSHASIDANLFARLEELLAKNEPAFLQVARYYIRQYHYVTSNSFDCLVPAMETMPYVRELVQKLCREEHGHGAFTAASLKELGVTDPTEVPLGPSVVALMGFLSCAAHLNGLAFACIFNLFELPGEQDEDPLAQLLARSSLASSARGIAAHFKFNKDGAHFTNGIHLVEGIEGVDAFTILEAARSVEMHFLLHENATREVMAYAERIAR